ncbi:hypothetical protein HanRHA438_Chr17g0825141 [Helianthus annuus]|nr:hypothetical protein HanRHA438_Chr17g0825141 [Helianthus annuus]
MCPNACEGYPGDLPSLQPNLHTLWTAKGDPMIVAGRVPPYEQPYKRGLRPHSVVVQNSILSQISNR